MEKIFLVIAVCLAILSLKQSHLTNAQADPNFPLVLVDDTEADIDATIQKTYVTTVGLRPVMSGQSQFNPNAFKEAAVPYYSMEADLVGYVDIDSITCAEISSTLLLVTYNVPYAIKALKGSANDSKIASTIGNYPQVSSHIGSPTHNLFSFYVFETTDENFQFSGNSVCDQLPNPCPASTQCTETLDGTSVLCQSPCKLEYCKNNGTCAQADENSEPSCSCLSKTDVYFLGARCQILVELWMIILVAVCCVFLIVASLVIACCVYAAKRRKKEKESAERGIEDVRSFTNKGFLHIEETPKTNKTRNGLQKKEIGVTALTAAPRPRSRTPSDRRYSRSRRHRESDDSRRRRRRSDSYDRHRHRRRHSSYTRSNSSVSSYNDNDSFDGSSDASQDEVTTTDAPLSSAISRHKTSDLSSGSSVSSTNRRSNPTSNEANFSGDNDVDIEVRNHGTSPIRWIPTSQSPKPVPGTKLGKINIADRKGWMPSLGPEMFQLGNGENNNATLSSPTRSGEYSYAADTEI